ncbi:MAG: hypothetical protein EA350_01325 [Gemmatimonadales bacterium]|nr:MAG: hypothetical protein EA350_01325 [Gemmatimonadales bacterium]
MTRRPMLPVSVLLLLFIIGGCARTIGPTGGPVPEWPPEVVATFPDTFAIVAPFSGPVRIEFERTLAERLTTGSLRDAVVVSPLNGEVTVSQRGRRLEISMEGGFRAPAVYRVTVLPRFQDRYRNTMDRPVELFFSTGPEFDETLVAGILLDRLTGEEVAGARVDAAPLEPGPTYSAVSDSTGVFAFRYLPPGSYRITAWDDVNRNREPDFTERQATTQATVASADTLVITELALLAPDTTAAVLASARALDSLAVELTFDDPLDPEWTPAGVRATLAVSEAARAAAAEEGREVPRDEDLPRVLEVLHRHVWEARQEAAADPPEPDDPGDPGDPDDPVVAAPPPVVPTPGAPVPIDPAAPGGPPTGAEDRVLPDQRLVLVFDRPLPFGMQLVVRVEGVRNLAEIPGGGGEAAFPTPQRPEAAPPDPPEDPPAGR